MRESGRPSARSSVPANPSLYAAIEQAGYFPGVVVDAVEDALGAEDVTAHLVHQETTFDSDEVRRHLTVLVLTPTRLLVAHTDDHPAAEDFPAATATTSVEVVPTSALRSVVLSRVVADPATHVPGNLPFEVVLTLSWGAVARVDLEPASCADPECEADHGYTGTLGADDLSLRLSAAAEGPEMVAAAVAFARDVSRLIGRGGEVR